MNQQAGRQSNGTYPHGAAKRKKRIKKNKDNLRGLQDIIKQNNICIIEVPEGEQREKQTENLPEEIWAENFPRKDTNIQVQEAQRVPNKMNPKIHTKTQYN